MAVQRVVAKKALKVAVRNFNSFIRPSGDLPPRFRADQFHSKIRGLADGHTQDLRFKSRLFRGGSRKATIDENYLQHFIDLFRFLVDIRKTRKVSHEKALAGQI